MKESVAAVVVTFNRKQLLIECLDALLSQSRKLDRIILIDNASTDGTRDLLQEKGYLENELVEYVLLPENTGGAGGFHEGMLHGLAAKADWLWLMDDDGLPAQDALHQLITTARKSHLDVIGPAVIDRENHEMLAFGVGRYRTLSQVERVGGSSPILGELNPFNGTLILAHIVRAIGPVKREMFIWGDEVEYLLRLKKNGIPFGVAPSAKFYHPAQRGHIRPVLGGVLGHVLLKPKPLSVNYYRNLGYMNSRYHGIKSHFVTLVKYITYFITNADLRTMKTFLAYYLDGARGAYRLPAFIRA